MGKERSASFKPTIDVKIRKDTGGDSLMKAVAD